MSPDGTLLALTRERGQSVTLHDTATGRYLKKLDTGRHPCVTFSAGGRLLVAAGSSILLWSVATGRLLRTIGEPFRDALTAVSRDRCLLANACNGRINVWSLEETMPCPVCATPLDPDVGRCPECRADFCQCCRSPFRADDARFRCMNERGRCEYHDARVCRNCVKDVPLLGPRPRVVTDRPADYVHESRSQARLAVFLAIAAVVPVAGWFMGLTLWVGIPAGVLLAAAVSSQVRDRTRVIPATQKTITVTDQVGTQKGCCNCGSPVEAVAAVGVPAEPGAAADGGA